MEQIEATDGKTDELEVIIKRAAADLQDQYKKRTDASKRIAEIKRTISGLAQMCERPDLKAKLLELVDHPSSQRQMGLTRSCRIVLIEASAPMTSSEVADAVQRIYAPLSNSKDRSGTVNTILNRLVRQGEVQKGLDKHGRLVWQWSSKSTNVRHPSSGNE